MASPLSRALADTVFAAGDAAIDSAVTIAARVPILASCLVSRSSDGVAEWQHACSEKALASWEGTLAACSGVSDILWRSLLSPFTPFGLAEETFALVRAVSQPGHSRVRANALRLGGR